LFLCSGNAKALLIFFPPLHFCFCVVASRAAIANLLLMCCYFVANVLLMCC
jgi:hypothetical protein